jgi:hypothetical protein
MTFACRTTKKVGKTQLEKLRRGCGWRDSVWGSGQHREVSRGDNSKRSVGRPHGMSKQSVRTVRTRAALAHVQLFSSWHRRTDEICR